MDLSDSVSRREFLDRECGSDAALRQRVEALLANHDATVSLRGEQANAGLGVTVETLAVVGPGSLIAGRYKLIEAIGEGGMGSVWLAEQKVPVRRKVAIKLIKAGMDSKQVLARFEAERQALAIMDHPNIAKVLDGGMNEQGRPYFVMEHVKGLPITEYCDQAKLSIKERLDLFKLVCHAVQHAHQKGIIHRDLKPSNILICLYDGKPVPKVIDFGLAKAMHQSLTEHSLHTAIGMMVGTPLYMSPEQAEHNNLDVDTRTDIYSLGVILYELLTGSTPLEKQQLKQAAFNEILRLIKEVEPPKPSARLSGSAKLPSIAVQRSIEPKQLSRSLTGDLDWIVMKALDKERSRRYETANGLSRDIDRFLSSEAVEACPPSTAYRMKKWLRRNRRSVLAASLVLFAVTAGTIAVVAVQAEANFKLRMVNTQLDNTNQQLESSNLSLDEQRKLAEERTVILRRNTAENALVVGAGAFDSGRSDLGRRSLMSAYALSKADPNLHEFVKHTVMDRLTQGGNGLLSQLELETSCMAFSSDRKTFATGSAFGIARIWDAQTGLPVTNQMEHGSLNRKYVKSIAFSPNGSQLATMSYESVQLWDTTKGTPIGHPLQMHENENWWAKTLIYSPDGERIVALGTGSSVEAVDEKGRMKDPEYWGELWMWDTKTGLQIGSPVRHANESISVAFGSEASQIVTYDLSKIRWIDKNSAQTVVEINVNRPGANGVFAPDGERIALWSETDNGVHLINARTGAEEALFIAEYVNRVRFLANGKEIAVTCGDYSYFWNVVTGAMSRLAKHDPGREAEKYRRDGDLLSFGPEADEIKCATTIDYFGDRIWPFMIGSREGASRTLTRNITYPNGTRLVRSENSNGGVKNATNLDGSRIAVLIENNTIEVRSTTTGDRYGNSIEIGKVLRSLVLSPSSEIIAAATDDKLVTLWDARTGLLLFQPIEFERQVLHVTFSPDGELFATQSWANQPPYWIGSNGDSTREVCLFETKTGTQILRLTKEDQIVGMAFSADSKCFAVHGWPYLIQAKSGKAICSLEAVGRNSVSHLAFSSDSSLFVSAGSKIEVRQTTTGEILGVVMPHLVELVPDRSNFTQLAIAANGKQFAVGTLLGAVQQYSLPTCQPIGPPMQHRGPIEFLSYNSDGTRLLSGSSESGVCLWNTMNCNLVTQLTAGSSKSLTANFSPDGRRFAVNTISDKSIQVYDTTRGIPIGQSMVHGDFIDTMDFTRDGSRMLVQTSHQIGDAVVPSSTLLWDLRTFNLPSNDSSTQDFFELLSGLKVDENGQTEALSKDELEIRRTRVRHDTNFWRDNLSLLAERRVRWNATQCNKAISECDATAALFYLRNLTSDLSTNSAESSAICKVLERKISYMQEQEAAYESKMAAAEKLASASDWIGAEQLFEEALRLAKGLSKPLENYCMQNCIACFVKTDNITMLQKAREMIYHPEFLAPGEPKWNLPFAAWLAKSSPAERKVAARNAITWYEGKYVDENSNSSWLLAWILAVDGETEIPLTVLSEALASGQNDSGDLLFLALTYKNSGDLNAAKTTTRLCRSKLHEEWGDAEAIQRRPWHERVCLEVVFDFLGSLEKSLESD